MKHQPRPPSLEEVTAALERVRLGTRTYIPDLELNDLLDCAFAEYGYCSVSCSPSTIIYRARSFDQDHLPDNVLDLWGPQASITRLQRLNKPQQVVVYACDDPVAALFELKPEPGSFVGIMTSILQSSNSMFRLIPLGLQRYVHASFLPGGGDPLRFLRFYQEAHARNCVELVSICGRFLQDVVADDPPLGQSHNLYRVTSSIADKLRNPECHGFIYPSVATGQSHLNFCFEAEWADQNFVPLEICWFRVGEQFGLPEPVNGRREHISGEITALGYCHDPSGGIEWKRVHYNHFTIRDARSRTESGFHKLEELSTFDQIRLATGRSLNDLS